MRLYSNNYKTIDAEYNGYKLTNWITILKGFTSFGGADYDVNTKDVSLNGTYFLNNRYKQKVIKVPFYIEYPNLVDYDNFQKALYVDSPKPLKFSHQPYRYFNAIPTGNLDFDEFRLNGKGVITFIIPDGVAHSTTYKKVVDFTESGEKLVFNITNNGNVPTYPIITAKMNSENGYFGLVNPSGVMEIGDREIIDSETRGFSERPFDYSDSGTGIKDGFTKGAKNVAISNDSTTNLDKNFSVINWLKRDHLAIDGTVIPSGNHGGSLTFDLPSDGSLFDRIWWRQIFHIGDPNQFGYIKILVSDTEGKFLYGMETIKRKFGYETEHNFMVTDGKGGYKVTDFQKTFKANEKDSDNPFNDNRGWTDIVRQDDQVNLYWMGSRIPKTFSELKDKKSAKLHVIMGGMGGKPIVTRMYLDGIKYQKDKVAFDYNIPNPYGKGSTVVINGENKTFYVDNIAKLNHVVDGSNWLKIPVGKSTLEINRSSWNESIPDIEIAFEERWL
ncbi:tail component [Streptococcus phage Str-PAP-1]|uniref:distal tail protein Dit n=1 Tax=Streptococcus phage Str-PAP-1 TaxID=1589270 RepID=UPI000588E75A|nr:distal tail protein Dit [Streptococcus phage Str-PAP-1]AJD83087.1 tail component [Streptococcus phage Str-PAP-1]